MKNLRKTIKRILGSFKSQQGVVSIALSVILTGFTIAGLLLAGGSSYVNYQNKIDMEDAVKMVREKVQDLRRKQGDNPVHKARIDALEDMADAMESNNDFNYDRKMLKTALDLGINLIPGQLPLAKGTKEAIEMAKNIYDLNNAINDSFGDKPEKPSQEMIDYYKILAKGKISPSALEIAILKTEAQAVNKELDKLLSNIEKQKAWKEGQRELLDDYARQFVKNSIKSSLEQLERTGGVSSYYRKLWQKEELQKELSNYPEIVAALEKPEDYTPVTSEEKEAVDNVVLDLISKNEVTKTLLAEDRDTDQGDWKKRVDKIVEKLEEIAEDTDKDEGDGDGVVEKEEEVDDKKEETFLDSIKKIWRGGTHNSFSFESDGSSIKYEAVRYDGWSIGTGKIDNVQPGSFVSHTCSLFNQHNTAIVVYVGNDGNLYYKVIGPYAVSGKERSYMGIVHSGMLASGVGSIDVSKLRVVRRGKYGLEVKWVNNQGETYQAEINQFHGVVKKEKAASESSVAGSVTAVGRILPCPDYNSKGPCPGDLDYLDRMRAQVEVGDVTVEYARENANHLELTFPYQGGSVSGSFVWEFDIATSYPGSGVTPSVNHWDVNFTGNYSGGKKGKFNGDLSGAITFSDGNTASLTGTWEADMKSDEMIEGMFYYSVTHPIGGGVTDQIAFRAATE